MLPLAGGNKLTYFQQWLSIQTRGLMERLKKSWLCFPILLFFVSNLVMAMQSSVDLQQEGVKHLLDKYAAATAQNKRVPSLEGFEWKSNHLNVASDALLEMDSSVLISGDQVLHLLIVAHFQMDRIALKSLTIDFGSFFRMVLSDKQLMEVIRLCVELILANKDSLKYICIQNINTFGESSLSVFRKELGSFEFLHKGFNKLSTFILSKSEEGVLSLSALQRVLGEIGSRLYLNSSLDGSILETKNTRVFELQTVSQNIELIENNPLEGGFQQKQNIETVEGGGDPLIGGQFNQFGLDQGEKYSSGYNEFMF